MLTPLQAFLSALLTAFIVQYLSLKYESEIPTVDANNKLVIIDRTVPKTLLLPTSLPEDQPIEVNKLLDAIFVSHGIETETVDEEKITEKLQKKEILILDESNFSLVYKGDWLILAHVPWYPSAKDYFDHFTAEFASIPHSSPVNLAAIDCNAHPLLAAILNVRQYPSLHLVTQSGRLREWPFELKPLDQKALSFIVNGHWKHLPVYQLLKPFDDKQQLFLSTFQIKAFNSFTSFTMKLQPKIFDWVVNNRPLTCGILSGLSILSLLITRKIQ